MDEQPAYLTIGDIEDYFAECEVDIATSDQLLAALRDGGDVMDDSCYFAPAGNGVYVCFAISLSEV